MKLQNMVYSNNSDILINDIGSGNQESLRCLTDHAQCCRDGTVGQWFYPNGSAVRLKADNQTFYMSADSERVRLHRSDYHDASYPTGLFCCELPDATSKIIRICVNIGE